MAKHHKFDRMKRRRQEIAAERMERLMSLADSKALAGELGTASRYATLSRSIGMRYNVRPCSSEKMKICKRCGRYLLPGATARIRLARHSLVRTCLGCGEITRMPLWER